MLNPTLEKYEKSRFELNGKQENYLKDIQFLKETKTLEEIEKIKETETLELIEKIKEIEKMKETENKIIITSLKDQKILPDDTQKNDINDRGLFKAIDQWFTYREAKADRDHKNFMLDLPAELKKVVSSIFDFKNIKLRNQDKTENQDILVKSFMTDISQVKNSDPYQVFGFTINCTISSEKLIFVVLDYGSSFRYVTLELADELLAKLKPAKDGSISKQNSSKNDQNSDMVEEERLQIDVLDLNWLSGSNSACAILLNFTVSFSINVKYTFLALVNFADDSKILEVRLFNFREVTFCSNWSEPTQKKVNAKWSS